MLALLSAVAMAADPAVEHPGPYEVLAGAEGRLFVKDADGELLSTRDTLWLASGPKAAAEYRTNRTGRKAAAFALWVGGTGTATLGVLVGTTSGDGTLAAGTGLLGVGLVGAGYGLLYAHPAERLDYWVEADALRARLSEPVPPGSTTATRSVRGWSVDGKGLVRGPQGQRVRVANVAAALGDRDTLEDYRGWQRVQYMTWGGVSAVGIGMMAVGMEQGASRSGERLAAGGYATAGLGLVTLGAGIVGITLADRPTHTRVWFTDAEIEEAVTLHNEGAVSVRERSPMVTVVPVIGPTYAGLTGTF